MTDWAREQAEIQRQREQAWTDGFFAGVSAEKDRQRVAMQDTLARMLDRMVEIRREVFDG